MKNTSDDGIDIGYQINLISQNLKQRINQELEPYGITVKQGRFLAYLFSRDDETVFQKDLETHFEISHPTTVGIIRRLELKGLVRSAPCENNRRHRIITPTDLARDLDARIRLHKKHTEELLLKDFTPNEQQSIRDLLQRILGNIR